MSASSQRSPDGAPDAEMDRSTTRKQRLRRVAGAALVGAVYWVGVKPRMMNWGATTAETTRPLPGDDLLPVADGVSTMAVSIDAPPEAVWPWLRQLGQERGGFYSYTWAENLLGFGIRNADEIVPEYQDLAVGDTVQLARADRFPDTALEVASMTPPRSLVLQTPDQPPWWVWAFVLEPVDETATRLLVRARIRLPENPVLSLASQLVLDPITFVMTRGMLLGIKSRVEDAVTEDHPTRADDGESERSGPEATGT